MATIILQLEYQNEVSSRAKQRGNNVRIGFDSLNIYNVRAVHHGSHIVFRT